MKRFVIALTLLSISATQPREAHSQTRLSPTGPAVRHVIDTHIHLFDPRRPDGIPWPPKTDKVLYKPHLPAEFTRIAKASGVTGVIIVEASDRIADNKWVLDLVDGQDFYVGLVGNVDPYRKDFPEHIDRLSRDKRFVGVRARNAEPIDFADPRVLANFRYLADKNLTLDFLANGQGIQGVQTVDRLSRAVPELRIVVDHMLGYDPDGNEPPQAWVDAVVKLAENPKVYCKVSGLYQRSVKQPAPKQIDYYRPVIDVLWNNFGQTRLIYGSNWPVTKHSGDYSSLVHLIDSYFASKGPQARERYYWKNASEAYRLGLK